MTISKKEVRKISELVRINLSPEEEEKMEKELSAVLDFVAKLNAVKTGGVKPFIPEQACLGLLREDIEPKEEIPEEKAEKAAFLVRAAPEHKDGFVKVKSVF